MDCFDYNYAGPTPSWVQGLEPAKYDDYKEIWESIDFSEFEDMFYDLGEVCHLEHESVQEQIVQKEISRGLDQLGFTYDSIPPREDVEGRDAWYVARRQARQTLDIPKMWWQTYTPSSQIHRKALPFLLWRLGLRV